MLWLHKVFDLFALGQAIPLSMSTMTDLDAALVANWSNVAEADRLCWRSLSENYRRTREAVAASGASTDVIFVRVADHQVARTSVVDEGTRSPDEEQDEDDIQQAVDLPLSQTMDVDTPPSKESAPTLVSKATAPGVSGEGDTKSISKMAELKRFDAGIHKMRVPPVRIAFFSSYSIRLLS
jgi:hypothetical protein